MTKIEISPKSTNDIYRIYELAVEVLKQNGYSNISVNGSVKLGRFNDVQIASFADFKLQIRNKSNVDFSLSIRGAMDNSFALSNYVMIHVQKMTIMGTQMNILGDSDNSEKLLEVVEAIEDRYNNQQKIMEVVKENPTKSQSAKTKDRYDVFISHASANKEDYVRKLVASIKKVTPSVWYDEDVLKWGDDLLKEIMNGLEHTEFAIVVFSKDFFGRKWTEIELKQLLEKQNGLGKKVVLPLLYDCTPHEFVEKYPSLDKILFKEASKCSIDEITIDFAQLLVGRHKEQS